MLEFLVNVLRVAPVVSALLLVAAVNTRRQVRVRQAWMPAVAIVYAIVALIVLYRLNDNLASMSEQTSALLPFLPVGFGTAWLYLMENTLVLLAFVGVKLMAKAVFARIFSKGRDVAQALVARVYSFDSDFELWFVERRYGKTRDLFRALYWTSMALSVLFIALAITFPGWPGFSAVAFPAIATMIIGEFYFAIDGYTRREYSSDLYGEQDVSRRVGNFGPLRRVLQETFPDRAIGDGVHLSSLAALDSGFRVGEMTRSPDASTRLAGRYFDRLRREGRDVDVNLTGATASLMSGTNVLFANPFHRDLSPYLALPTYRELLDGRKCLIIAGRDSQATELVAWMSHGLEDITGVPGLWRVRVIDDVSREDWDVGVLPFAEVHNLELLINNDELIRRVGLLILAEPSLMLTTGQLGLEMALERCNRDSPTVVAAFDGNHDGIVDTLSHLMKSNLTEVVASSLPQGSSSEVIWRSDGPHMHTSILPGVSRYLGVGTEISAVALKYQVGRVHWVGGNAFPVTDMKWIAEQYYAPINSFADLDMSQDALSESLVAVANPWDLGQEENYFLVVEDQMQNVFETVRQYSSRAKRAGFINLISDDYMLRDYMVSNRDIFAIDPKAIPSIVPDYTRTERNVVLRMLLTLRAFGMTEAEIAKQLDLLNWVDPTDDPVEMAVEAADWESRSMRSLKRAIAELTGCRDAPIAASAARRLQSYLHDEEPVYLLDEGSSLDDILATLGPTYFFVEDDIDGVNVIGSMLLGHVHQVLMSGQFLTYGGKYYEVQAITQDQARPRVVLRRAADHIRDRRVYRQRRAYTLSNLRYPEGASPTKRVGGVSATRLLADVAASSLGYTEVLTRSDVGSGRRVDVPGLPVREYRAKHVLQIHVPDATVNVRKTLTVLLNEIFVTVFPHAHHFVVAVTPEDEGANGDLLPMLDVRADEDVLELSAHHSIFVVEDSMIDLGLTVAVERHWERLLEIATDYLAWNLSEEPLVDAEEMRATTDDPVSLFPERPHPETTVKEGFLGQFIQRVRRLLPGSGRKARVPTVHTPPVQPAAQAEGSEPQSHDIWKDDAHLKVPEPDVSRDSAVDDDEALDSSEVAGQGTHESPVSTDEGNDLHLEASNPAGEEDPHDPK